MQIDYQKSDDNRRMSRTAKWIMVVVLAVGSIPVLIVAEELFIVWERNTEFEEQTSQRKLIGKTPKQIIGLLGRPDDQVGYSAGNIDLIYDGGIDSDCRVEVRGGVAVRIVHWTH